MFAYSRRSSINWRECAHVLYSSTPAAFAAAGFLNLFSEALLKLTLYVVMMVSSVFSLRTLLYAMKNNDRHNTIPQDASDVMEMTSFDTTVKGNNSSPLDSPPALASAAADNEAVLIDFEDLACDATDEPATTAITIEARPTSGSRIGMDDDLEAITKYKMWTLGFTTGFISPLTGTSGPVVFLPLALTINYPILNALGAAQAVQLPIAIAASLSFSLTSKVNVPLGLAIALGASPGVVAGSAVAHRINKYHLQVIITSVLCVTSIVLLSTFALTYLL